MILPADSHAQVGKLMQHLFGVDTTAPPDYDTSYIRTYRQNPIFTAVTNLRIAGLQMEDTAGRSLSWYTNSATQYGGALDFNWFSFEWTVNVPAFDRTDPARGKTDLQALAIGYTSRRIWFRGIWNRSTGFYSEGTGNGNSQLIVRPDMRLETYLGSINYAIDGYRKFTQQGALWQLERQKKSAGTWVVGASCWLTRLSADSSLVPAAQGEAFSTQSRIKGSRRNVFGAMLGYTHDFIFFKKCFLHASVLTGPAYSHQVRELDGAPEPAPINSLSNLIELKGGTGYNSDRWFCSVTGTLYYSADGDDARVSLGATLSNIRFAAGIRFGRPNIRGLEKVGL